MAPLSKRLQQIGVSLLGLATLLVMVILQLADPAPLERVRLQIFDAYQKLAPRDVDANARVVLVDIDEDSIDRLGQWPWPRSDLAILTRRLARAGAQAVVYDIVFSEPDRTSPEAIASRLETNGGDAALASQLARLPGHDAQLAESFAGVPVVTGYFLDREKRGEDVQPKVGISLHGSLPREHVPSYSGALQPLPALEAAAAGSGFVSLESDADGIVRRVPLLAIHRNTLIPSLALEAARLARGSEMLNLLASDGSGETGASPGAAVMMRLGAMKIPVNDAGEMWIHFPRSGSQPIVPAWPIVSGEMSEAELAGQVAGRIAIVGGSAAGLQDLVSTPAAERIAGVTVHAAALEQILAGHFLERPDWAFGLELLLVLVIGTGFAFVLPRLGALLGAVAAITGIAAVAWASWLGFTKLNYLFDPTYPALTLALVYTVQTVAVYYREERQRSYIHHAFDRFLSPEMVRQIAENPARLELGGEERDMTVLMCDIRGFSHISERRAPQEVIEFLIEFLTPMSDILMAHRATIDKYIGDAILAFWNAPLDDPDHHSNAARAALAMTSKLDELNRTRPRKSGVIWPDDVKIGIGLNSGLCCVGNMGSKQRLAYSLIGDTVNVASRLEGLTKHYGVEIIVGEALAEQLEGFGLMEIDEVRVVGRDAKEKIFALLGHEAIAESGRFDNLIDAHHSMLKAYRNQAWAEVHRLLSDHRSLYEGAGIERLADLFATRASRLELEPPGPDWDGVYEATEK